MQYTMPKASTQNPVPIIQCLQPSAHALVPKTAGNPTSTVSLNNHHTGNGMRIDTIYGIRIAKMAKNWNFIVIIFIPDTV